MDNIAKKLALLTILVTGISGYGLAQFPQMQRAQERMQQSEAAEAERQKQLEEEKNNNKVPEPKPAVMNVDVKMSLAGIDMKTFAEADKAAVNRVVDGDPLWLYIKFDGKLGQYVRTTRDSEGIERYRLFLEYGPQGDVTAKSHYTIELNEADLDKTELKLSLTAGKLGHNNALPIFLKSVTESGPGLWNNELRLSNMLTLPRGAKSYLAKTPLVTDLSKGLFKYPRVLPQYESMVLRDSLDETVVPLSGEFEDSSVRAELVSKIAALGIVPGRVFFAGDNWLEYSSLPDSIHQFRSVTGVFIYQKEGACLYGTAKIIQPFDPASSRYGISEIEIKKGMTRPCPQR